MIDIGELPGGPSSSTWAHDFNDYDMAVGGSRSAAQPGGEAFIWDVAGGIRGLGAFPGGVNSTASGINNLGQVCGYASSATACCIPFIWDAENGMRPLGPPPAGYWAGSADCINDLGQVAGIGVGAGGGVQSYFWDPVIGYTLIPRPDQPRIDSRAWNLNNRGQVIGRDDVDAHNRPAWIWDRAHGKRLLADQLEPCLPSESNYSYIEPIAINDSGKILVMAPFTGIRGHLLTPYVLPDTDRDNDVDLADLAVVLTHFGQSGPATSNAIGDVDEDFDVDISDLAHVLIDFGWSCTPP